MPELTSTVVMILVGVLVLGVIAYFVFNLTRPTVTRKARVIGKNKQAGVSTAKCTFEFEDGTREEFDTTLDTYAAVSPGDVGYVSTRGVVFWGFRREGPSAGPPIPEEPLGQIKEALFRGQKIDAIRLYRQSTGCGLAEAKAVVDRLEAEMRDAGRDR